MTKSTITWGGKPIEVKELQISIDKNTSGKRDRSIDWIMRRAFETTIDFKVVPDTMMYLLTSRLVRLQMTEDMMVPIKVLPAKSVMIFYANSDEVYRYTVVRRDYKRNRLWLKPAIPYKEAKDEICSEHL